MKLTIALLFAVTMFGQTELCYKTGGKEACMTITPAAANAMREFVESQKTPAVVVGEVVTPSVSKYRGPAHLIFEHVRTLLDTLLEKYPGAAEKSAKDAAAASLAKATAARQAALPALPGTEPE